MGDNMAEVVKKKKEETLVPIPEEDMDKQEEKAIKKEKKKKAQKKEKIEEESKKNIFEKFKLFCKGVWTEALRVRWTSKKDMVKYSIATIIFIVFFSLFFYGIDAIFAFAQSLFK